MIETLSMKAVFHAPKGPSWNEFQAHSCEVELEAVDLGAPGWWRVKAWQDLGPLAEDERRGAARNAPRLHEGFFDTHLHVTWMGQVEGAVMGQAFAEVGHWLEALKLALATQDPTKIFFAYAWDESRWGLRKERLAERAEAELPATRAFLIYRVCGHAAFASRALREQLGLGHLPFLLDDAGLAEVHARLPAPSVAALKESFLQGQKELLASGVSAVGDMSLEGDHFQAIAELFEEGCVHLDVQGVILDGKAPRVQDRGPHFQTSNSVSPFLGAPATFSVRHWKRYLDGSLGARSAWLSLPYEDAESFGQRHHETHELVRAARLALEKGFCLSFHSIGDAALDQLIEVGQGLLKPMRGRLEMPGNFPLPGTRHRVEHGQVMRDEQLRALVEQGCWALCAQPGHRVADQDFVKTRLGEKRHFEQGYRAATLLEGGLPVVLGTDAPVIGCDPEKTLIAACTHPNPKERLDFDFALWAYTRGARRLLGLPERTLGKGSLVRSTLAGDLGA
jgi:predicted amidohydrolase YtcJ